MKRLLIILFAILIAGYVYASPEETQTAEAALTLTEEATLSVTMTPTITPTITETITKTITKTITPTRTRTKTFTPTPTNTQRIKRLPTKTVTKTITPTRTVTPTRTITKTVTPTRTITKTVTQTITKTITQTVTPTNTPSFTRTVTPTASISPTFTITPTFVAFTITLITQSDYRASIAIPMPTPLTGMFSIYNNGVFLFNTTTLNSKIDGRTVTTTVYFDGMPNMYTILAKQRKAPGVFYQSNPLVIYAPTLTPTP
jgi:hypothetical protein